MARSMDQFKPLLKFREKKSEEMKRPVSFSEAIALWLSERMENIYSEPYQKSNSGFSHRF